MACEQASSRFSRLAGQVGSGIARLANKRAFYAGLMLGGTGLLGAGLVAWARRQCDPRRAAGVKVGQITGLDLNPEPVKRAPLPQLALPTRIRPMTQLPPAERCTRCRVRSQNKPGAWYTIEGQPYCPDCAPEAAAAANVELVLPEPVAVEFNGVDATRAMSRARLPATDSRRSGPGYLPAERRVATRLAPSRIRLNVGRDPEGQPVWFVVEQGQVVLRPDGSDTGLAITPALKIGDLKDGVQDVAEDTGRWWITHIPSGKTLGTQPYARLDEAQLLAGVLAQVDWTRAETEIGAEKLRQVRETVRRFNQALAGHQVGVQTQPTSPQPEFGPAAEPGSLAGKLVADGYGGVARVLADQGETLFLIDNLGARYEVSRREVRPPDEHDFELCRVAMSFDPAKKPETRCAQCGQSSRRLETGETWYRMGRQAFCRPCSSAYAAEEGYIKDEEISSELEPMV
jgi:hypothetical protein